MRISFDIDDTLVCRNDGNRKERGWVPDFIHLWFGETLRRGTRTLFRELRRRGFSIWIYTTSVRTPIQIRMWLMLHGIRVDGVVNEERHRLALAGGRFDRMPSKYPPAFDIDLHVDDSEGVKMEGDAHGFNVVIIQPDDEQWENVVLIAAEQIKHVPQAEFP
jgi:hypothetical protein